MLLGFFPGLKREQLPGGEAWATEVMTLSTHSGTHLDAPYHYHSTMDGGERAITIDELPLDWCFGRGVKLDFRNLPDGYVATAEDIRRELERISTRWRRETLSSSTPPLALATGRPTTSPPAAAWEWRRHSI